jgi:hypothetical protein
MPFWLACKEIFGIDFLTLSFVIYISQHHHYYHHLRVVLEESIASLFIVPTPQNLILHAVVRVKEIQNKQQGIATTAAKKALALLGYIC